MMLANESSHDCSAISWATSAQMSSSAMASASFIDLPRGSRRLPLVAASAVITTVADSRANISGHSLHSWGA
ncbi:Uncharacterised protein [Mycobacterium tuberculosis]|nr:Uncharacterised protein [Mycobacterium tuberculosis]